MTANEGHAGRTARSDTAARRQRRIGWIVTGILCFVYLTYLCLVIAIPQNMSINIGGNVTPGLALGAGVIFFALALSFYYVAQANRNEIEQVERS